MADHSTIILFPLLFLVLVSGSIEEERTVGFGDSLYQKTSAIVSASFKNLTKEQISSLNQMISKLNENITLMVGGRNLEDFKTNETAVKQIAEIVKDDIIMYNSFVVDIFNLTEKEVEMTRDEFCKAVAKICDKTWVLPPEFKTAPTNETEMLETLHKGHKDLIDGAINHNKNKTDPSTKKIVEDTPKASEQPMKETRETMKNEGQSRMDNMESFSSALKPDWTWTIWIVIAASLFATF
jgi:hypothetical protein